MLLRAFGRGTLVVGARARLARAGYPRMLAFFFLPSHGTAGLPIASSTTASTSAASPPTAISPSLSATPSTTGWAMGRLRITYSSGPAAPNFADDTGDPVTWEQNTAIAVITVPAATGNPKPTYAAQGALPAGVTYTAPGASDDNGGTIRGTSTALGSGTITIRATNTQGSDDWTLAFTTRAPPPPGVLETVVGDGGTSGTKTWNPRPRPLIPASLVDGGGAAYLDQVSINDIGDYSLQTTSSASGGSGITAGPELTSRWENYAEALTISAGGCRDRHPRPELLRLHAPGCERAVFLVQPILWFVPGQR